ncbi:deoxynucleotide monophosphate kinase [Pseudomonas sp. RtIB026]|uniref:deoxynucleotide monophosphate kinase family protein n=1 Tax=Pseudomonas sp. RtIB026 TaxID=2749999 RepID=UPI001FD17C73|nr:deoxynucleotide monophosphate kinase [Pseudomonas sp. RtIB026]
MNVPRWIFANIIYDKLKSGRSLPLYLRNHTEDTGAYVRKIIGLAAPARSGKDTVAAMLLAYPGVAAYALADPLKMGCQALFGLTDEETWADALKEQKLDDWARSPREFFQQVGTEWMRVFNSDHWLMRAERAIEPQPQSAQPLAQATLSEADAPIRLAAQAFFGFTEQQTWDPHCSRQIDPFWQVTPEDTFAFISQKAVELDRDYLLKRALRPVMRPKPLPFLPAQINTIVIKDIRFENEASFLRSHNGVIWHVRRPDALRVNAHSSESGIQQNEQDILIVNDGTIADLEHKVAKAWATQQSR